MKKKIYIAAAIVAVLAAGTSSISCFGQSQAEEEVLPASWNRPASMTSPPCPASMAHL